MNKIERGLEEYYRRIMVKLVREAGTAIRKEMVKRQALTAEVNLKYAESLRRIIEEDYRLLSKPFEDVFKGGYGEGLKGRGLRESRC